MSQSVYKRVLIKLSGEALAGEKKVGLDFKVIDNVCKVIKKCVLSGVEVGIVVGGGNFWRGVKDGGGKMERSRADQMGMLSTAMNALVLNDVLSQNDVPSIVLSATAMPAIADLYSFRAADAALKEGKVVIFACGTGNPYFSTDTGAVLRATEIHADVILLAKNIDGVYDSDPAKNPDAKRYDTLTYDEMLEKHLMVIDSTAASLAMDNDISIMLFELKDPENIMRVISGEKIGTIIKK